MSERVKDEELAEIERDVAGYLLKAVGWGEYEVRLARAAVRLTASERVRREEDAAIGRMLDEAGIDAREGETLRARIEWLIEDANEESERADSLSNSIDTINVLIEDLVPAREDDGSPEGGSLFSIEQRVRLLCGYFEQAKTRAEKAEAELAALRAPVDVEGEVKRLAAEVVSLMVHPLNPGISRVEDIGCRLAPTIGRAAQLAREAEGLRGALLSATNAWTRTERDLAAARAEIERLADERAEHFSRD